MKGQGEKTSRIFGQKNPDSSEMGLVRDGYIRIRLNPGATESRKSGQVH